MDQGLSMYLINRLSDLKAT